jgi:hypothetical protein
MLKLYNKTCRCDNCAAYRRSQDDLFCNQYTNSLSTQLHELLLTFISLCRGLYRSRSYLHSFFSYYIYFAGLNFGLLYNCLRLPIHGLPFSLYSFAGSLFLGLFLSNRPLQSLFLLYSNFLLFLQSFTSFVNRYILLCLRFASLFFLHNSLCCLHLR